LRSVTAVTAGARARTLPCDGVGALIEIDSLSDLHTAAGAAKTELLWIIGPGAVPSEETLPALLEAGHVPAASLPVDAPGAPIEAAVGRFAEHDAAALIDAARDRRVPLRHTRVTSLLVDRHTVLAAAPPDPHRYGPYAGSEWTARVFASSPALLVPASRIRTDPPAAGTLPHALRTARAAGWGMGETLREMLRSVSG
jgi:hypothetical protein